MVFGEIVNSDSVVIQKLSSNEWKTRGPNHTIFTQAIGEVVTEFKPNFTQFKQNPVVELDDEGFDFCLQRDVKFYFYIDIYLNIYIDKPDVWNPQIDGELYYVEVTVHAGFITDFVSSPPLLWSIQSPLGRSSKPAVLHDVFYRERCYVVINGSSVLIGQDFADLIFKLGLELRGVSRVRTWAMYTLLQAFGSKNFHKFHQS